MNSDSIKGMLTTALDVSPSVKPNKPGWVKGQPAQMSQSRAFRGSFPEVVQMCPEV